MTTPWDMTRQLVDYVILEHPSISQAMQHAARELSPHLRDETKRLINDHDYQQTETTLLVFTIGILTTHLPPKDPVAFSHGLFDTQGGLFNKFEYQRVYLYGSNRFDADDRDGEWACNPSWFPDRRYFHIPLLKQIGKLEGTNELCTSFLLAQTFAAAMAIVFAPLIVDQLVQADQYQQPIPIATGHDAGDLFILGKASPSGFQRP